MAANISPVFTLTPNVSGALVVTAAAAIHDISGTVGTDVYQIFAAGGAPGSFVEKIRVKYAGNSTTTSNAACLKIWVTSANSGLTMGTNSWLLTEVALPATGALSTTVPAYELEIPVDFALKNGFYIMAKITVSQPANFGFLVTAVGGDLASA